jgi:EAL domain-containing protein (putative c-di-GMP-specific phosphodiesterase class I)
MRLQVSSRTVESLGLSQRQILAAMVTFTTGIGATLIAEGIETHTELVTVTGLGVKAGQGYLLGRPSVRRRNGRTGRNRPSVTRPRQRPAP